MFATGVNEDYHIFNASNKLSAYGYVYYASLYDSESYAISVFLDFLALIGIGATIVLLLIHLCAICYAHHHLYRTIHLSLGCVQKDYQSFTRRVWNAFYRICRGLIYLSKCLTRRNRVKSNKLLGSGLTRDPSTTAVQLSKISVSGTTSPCPAPKVPGVSIIKPLTGVDVNLEVNLTSFFLLDYPQYELLFCVADPNDPACEVVRTLQQTYPQIPSRLIIAEEEIGINPKINNLQAGYLSSRFELILISDAGIWMRPDTLTDMVATLLKDPLVGMVHQVPFLTPYFGESTCPNTNCLESQTHVNGPSNLLRCAPSMRPSFAWIVQLVFFGCWHAKIALCASFLGINCTTGMSCLIRKSTLTEAGGFKPFAFYLAEDFFLAKYLLDRGWYVRVSHQPAWQNSPSTSLDQFRSRLNRWAQLRLSMVLLAYLLEPFSRCLPNALLGAFGFSYLFPDFVDPGVYFLCHLLIWFLLDYILLLHVYPPCVPLCITRFEYLVAWIFSELTAIPNHIGAAFKRELHWRDKKFRIHWGGLAEQIKPKQTNLDTSKGVNTSAEGNTIVSAV